MKTNFELVRDFHFAFNKEPDPTFPTEQSKEVRDLRAKLIFEEVEETFDEMGIELNLQGCIGDPEDFIDIENHKINLVNLAKELADLLYVTYGAAAKYGIPIDDIFREVHRSNMSKLGSDGKPIYREDGKVPVSYTHLRAHET